MAEPVPESRVAVRKGLRSVAWMIGGLVLLTIALSQTDLGGAAVEDLWTRLSLVRLVLAFTVMTVGLSFLALRWRSLMPIDTRQIGIPSLTSILLIGSLLNYALPGPVGEFAAAALASRRFGIASELAFAAGIHARFVGLGVAGTVALLLLAVAPLPVPPEYLPWITTASVVIGTGVIALTLLSARPQLLRAISAATVGKVLPSLDASVARFCDALASVGRVGPLRYAIASLWAFCGHACVIGGILIAAWGLGAHPAIAGMAFTYAIATAGAIVLYAFPGSQVGWDGMFCTLLVATSGVTLPDALALTLVVRLQQLLVVSLGAVAMVVQEWRGERMDEALPKN